MTTQGKQPTSLYDDGGAPRFSLAETLEDVEDHLPRALVSPRAYERVKKAAAQLPAALSRQVYLECRLAEHSRRVDLIVGVERDGARVLAGHYPSARLAEPLRRIPAWSRLSGFCREWLRRGSILDAGVERVWLELDLDARAGASPEGALTPGIFVNFSPDACAAPPWEHRLEVALESVSRLADEETQGVAGALERCFHSLPPEASPTYVGIFTARWRRAVRVCIRGLCGEAAADFLEALGWPMQRVEWVRHWLGATIAEDGARPVLLHVEVGEGLKPALGLEFALSRPSQLRGELAELGWLDGLVRRRLCAPRKRLGLRRWPGRSVQTFRHELWPSLVTRWVNHVKLVVDDGRLVEAKAYLYLRHDYEPRLTRRG